MNDFSKITITNDKMIITYRTNQCVNRLFSILVDERVDEPDSFDLISAALPLRVCQSATVPELGIALSLDLLLQLKNAVQKSLKWNKVTVIYLGFYV